MITAYVLINAHIGKEKDVPSQLRNVDEVKELLETTGKFDFVAKVESTSHRSLQDVVKPKIRKMDSIRSTLLVDNNYRASNSL